MLPSQVTARALLALPILAVVALSMPASAIDAGTANDTSGKTSKPVIRDHRPKSGNPKLHVKIKATRTQVMNACVEARGEYSYDGYGYSCVTKNCDGAGGDCSVTCSRTPGSDGTNCYGSTPGKVARPSKGTTVPGVLGNTSSQPVGGTYQPPANKPTASGGTYQPPAAGTTPVVGIPKPVVGYQPPAKTSKPVIGIRKPTVGYQRPAATRPVQGRPVAAQLRKESFRPGGQGMPTRPDERSTTGQSKRR